MENRPMLFMSLKSLYLMLERTLKINIMSNTQVEKIYKVTDTQILGFFREHRFLSNFHECEIDWNDLTYNSTEAAYQASKCWSSKKKEPFTKMTPSEAKMAGQNVTLREDWDAIKEDIMLELTRIKYTSHPDLAELLLQTGNRKLVEENWWGDTYWGCANGEGQNRLGNIIMTVRDELKPRLVEHP